MIVVTGASKGIGNAIAKKLHEDGKNVLGLARTSFKAEFSSMSVDVTSMEELQHVAHEIRMQEGSISGLINCAGIASMNLALMTPESTTRRLIETNLLGTIFSCQIFSRLIIRNGGGSVINFSTIAVPLGLSGEAIYVASKAGVEGFSRVLARELSGHNIRVNCISPGPISTDLIKGISEDKLAIITGQQIIRRQFEISDVTDVVQLLLDRKATSISGETIHIGGV